NTPGAAALLRKTNVNYVKPEEVKAFELGYRSRVNNVNIDINAYYNIYNNFIGAANAVAPYYGIAQYSPLLTPNPADPTNTSYQTLDALQNGNFRVYQLYTNADVEIKSFGFGLGLSKKVYKDFEFCVNYNFAE